ncbi:GNAT family N-acetyltransferase [Lacticaseibacillus suibinensis]|uniref:GNAT family N-acetyltransferase n=1 Tax=Lacticaseibacillus suibinensis TaxID=2486011 RepID=UPI000F7A1BD4|nr:GNAT family protein [Lacticaseibacillus suibinensis]
MTVTIRPLRADEQTTLWQLAYSNPNAEWTKWNGPYFHDVAPTLAEFLAARRWVANPLRQVIVSDGELVGAISAYYEDGDLKRWLEVGLVIYREGLWGQHLGRQALRLWLTHLFAITDLPHLGFTTWSGNERMLRLGAAVGMKEEGRIRQVCFWQGQYYDSVKYGILREEWRKIQD